MTKENQTWLNKNFLIAVDDSANSRRAVQYVSFLLGHIKGVHITLLHVIPEPEEDFFSDVQQKQAWLAEYRQKMEGVLKDYFQILVDGGIAEKDVEKRIALRYCPSMAECILAERDDRDYGTIVVGRQGLSRKEQFLFGSISSKIVHHARKCSVWVVE